jgi:TerC family integral membrane protein
MSGRKAVLWSLFWVALSLILNAVVYFAFGEEKAIEFFTGYVIEKSLSLDNLFVFLMIFSYFGVVPKNQRRILNYGIIGVVFLRGFLIFVGAALVHQFHWITFAFAAILLYSGYHIIFGKDNKIDLDRNIIVRWFRKAMPVSNSYTGNRFFERENGLWMVTPLLVILLIIETTDVVFAFDSIPAIFSVTTDPLIVFSSNLMAVLGLRSMYFVLERTQKSFAYVKYGVGIVLVYIGVKMMIADIYKITIRTSLFTVMGVLVVSVLLSYFVKPHSEKIRENN